ncbi:MAG TPA: hypothetical protein VGB55_11080 [Tepidisphaeraceae bacterium]
MIAAAALAGLLSMGCEEKREGVTDQATDAAEKSANQGSDALNKAENAVEKGVENAGEGAQATGSNIQELIGKAKDSLDKNNFDEASTYVKQAEDMKSKLPEAARKPLENALDEVKRKIQEGKSKLNSGS